MEVKKVGDGDPEYTVIGSIHGDEPCGKKAIEKFLSENWEIRKPVKFIIANEEALEKDERYLDMDLNRSFPGDPESGKHEERLAVEIMNEVRGTKVLDIHSTRSNPVPFLTLSELNETVVSLVESTGVSRAAYFPREAGAMNEHVDGIIVEVGRQGTEEAVEMAYGTLVNFLAAEGVIDADYRRSEPDIFEYQETVEGGDWKFAAENFQKVERGEVFAENSSEELVAEQDFYPVLMSTDGYEDILGFKAEKVEKVFR